MRLNKDLAQNISDKVMEILPYNINIMNEKGVIIGSGDKTRIDTIHEGAIEAISNKTMNEVYSTYGGAKPGVNTPIFWRDNVIGVIGITGVPNEVKPFGELVCVTAELLIDQEYTFNQIKTREKLQEEVLYELAYNTNDYSDNLIARCSSLSIDLNVERVAILVQFDEIYSNIIRRYISCFKGKNEYSVILSGIKIVLFLKCDSQFGDRLKEFVNYVPFDISIGVGLRERIIGKSVIQADDAIKIGKKLYIDKNIYYYESLYFISTLSNFKGNIKYIELIENLEKYGKQADLINTLIVYINENIELQNTAKKLHIHRNTLNYRLEKIHELTNKDPRNILELWELYTSYIISKL